VDHFRLLGGFWIDHYFHDIANLNFPVGASKSVFKDNRLTIPSLIANYRVLGDSALIARFLKNFDDLSVCLFPGFFTLQNA